jgi:hypothetical protein
MKSQMSNQATPVRRLFSTVAAPAVKIFNATLFVDLDLKLLWQPNAMKSSNTIMAA